MISVEDIKDEDSLRAWLEALPKGRRYKISATIAARAALRAQPRLWSHLLPVRPNSEFTSLMFVRSCLISAVACNCPSADIKSRAAAAAGAAARAAADDATAYAAARAAAAAVRAAAAARADAAAAAKAAAADIWYEIRTDAHRLLQGNTVWTTPLWSNGENPYAKQWTTTKSAWADAGAPWSTFAQWYDDLLAGRDPNWPLLEHIALADPDDWEGSDAPQKIAARIEGFPLIQGLKKTADGELISVNPKTGNFRADPVSELPKDHLQDAVDSLSDALELFIIGNDFSNQHTAILPELNILQSGLERYSTRPRKLHQSCVRILSRLDVKIKRGECPKPEEDADLTDLLALVSSAQSTLFDRDPLVREAVDGSAKTKLPEMSQEEADTLVKAADEAAEHSEGDLKEELPTAARIATDPNAPIEERKEAFKSTAGRLLRIRLLAAYGNSKAFLEELDGVSKTVAGISKNVAFCAASGTAIWHGSPMLKAAWDWILSVL